MKKPPLEEALEKYDLYKILIESTYGTAILSSFALGCYLGYQHTEGYVVNHSVLLAITPTLVIGGLSGLCSRLCNRLDKREFIISGINGISTGAVSTGTGYTLGAVGSYLIYLLS